MSTTGQTQTTPHSDQTLDIRYYADCLWRRRILLTATALAGIGLGVLVGYLPTPKYRATTLLQVEPPSPTFLPVTDALVGTGNVMRTAQFYNTQFKVLRSRELGQKVIERLKLDSKPPFKGRADAALLFMSYVRLEPVPESLLIEVQVTHPDPKEAALWANSLTEIYIDNSLEARVDSVKRAYEWLQDRLSATEQSMREAQDKLLKSYESEDLFVPEGSVSAVTTSITKLNDDYVGAQARRIALEAALRQFSDLRRRGQGVETVPQVASDSIVLGLNGQLAGLDVEMSRLKGKYKEAHPEVQKVQAQIAQIRRAREARGLEIEQGLRAEYRQLLGREGELKAAIEGHKAQAAVQTRKVAELESLKKEAESAKNLYGVLLQKLNETNIAASVQNDNIRIVQRAWPPDSPVWPQRGKLAGAGVLLGLVLGAAFVLLRDHLDNTLKDPDEVERYLHLDVLAAVPRYDRESVHLVTEAYQNLRTSLLFSRKDKAGQVVLITGTAPEEGKTTTLVNIAKLLAVSGERTVVLDGDLRRANLHTRLGVVREPGLTDYFVNQRDVNDLVRPTRVNNLYALTAGPLPPNPPGILARDSLASLLEQLRRHFQWILVDSPPLASVTDALLLARHADMAVLVVQHNKIDKKVVRRSVAALRKVTGNLIGAVLNAVNVKTHGYYYYYYQQRKDKEKVVAHGPRPARPSRPVAVA